MLEDRIISIKRSLTGTSHLGFQVPAGIVLGSLAGCMEINEVGEEYGLERHDALASISISSHKILR